MSGHALTTWSGRLRAAAGPTLAAAAERPGAEFQDESGHRRAVDAPFLAWRSRAAGCPVAVQPLGRSSASVDVALWRGVLDRSVAVEPLIGSPDHGAASPITPLGPRDTIEVWTETELCALHALWRIGRLRDRPELIDRCIDAARWHVEHLQPDNATNHPWAIHVFIIAGRRLVASEHDLHAQAMLHNSRMNLGRPDAFSAHILMDAAECLDEIRDEDRSERADQTP